MYIRSKVVKSATYYQVVDGYRDAEGRVRHRTVASLGRCPTIEEAIRQIGATEARIRHRLAKLPEVGLSRTQRAKRDRLAARLTQQGARRTVLQEVANAGSVDTTPPAP